MARCSARARGGGWWGSLHTYEGVAADLLAWLPKLRRPGGVVIFNDYGEVREDVRRGARSRGLVLPRLGQMGGCVGVERRGLLGSTWQLRGAAP